IGTDEGLDYFGKEELLKKDISFKHYKHNPNDPSSISENKYLQLFIDRENNIWIRSSSTMLDIIPAAGVKDKEVKFYHLLPALNKAFNIALSSTNSFYVDAKNNCWLGTVEQGLFKFSVDEQFNIMPLANFKNIQNVSSSISANSISSFYEDKVGFLWIGTQSNVSKYNSYQSQFFVINEGRKIFFETNFTVTAIACDELNTTWIASESDSVFAIDSNGNIKSIGLNTVFKHDRKNPLSLCAARNGDIYLGTPLGICVMKKSEKEKFLSQENYIPKIDSITVPSLSQGGSFVRALIEDHGANIWLGSGAGLNRFNPLSSKADLIRGQGNTTEATVRCIVESSDRSIWFGTDNGLFQRLSSQKIDSFYHSKNDSASLPDNGIICLYAGANNLIWIGTKKGLCSHNSVTKKFKAYKFKNLDDRLLISAIESDSHQNLWMSTNNGLVKFNPETKEVVRFTVADGLGSNLFNATASSKSKDGRLLFGNEKGLVSFYPDKLNRNKNVPQINLTDFKIFDHSIFDGNKNLVKDFLEKKEITLKYNQNFFTINFAAMDFADPKANTYSYFLEDVDPDTVYAGNRNYATYTNMQPGEYVFTVKAANNHGVWNNKGVSMRIIIPPPWWRTWWFYFLCLLAFTAAVWGLYKYRINQIKKLFSLRSKIARDLHDDIGSTLSSISLMSHLATSQTDDASAEKELFNTISSASKEAMDLMSDIVWSVNPNNDKVGNILIRMREYASGILDASGIQVEMKLDDTAKDLVIPMEKRKDFYLIFKEAVNNMAKYSEATSAIVHLFRERNVLVLEVKDNGKGFDVDKLRSGNGVVNMNQRAKFIGAVLLLKSELGKGTTVRLEIPFE
ncbi:MAG: histidine kinase, partial [Chitinophagales bacterium]|nr:histidine kinase [Chitinophagales bacterium]